MSLSICPRSGLLRIRLVGLVLCLAAGASTLWHVRAGDEPATDQNRGAISGRIVDHAGAPVAGARIELWRQAPKYRFVPKGMPMASDAEGNFRFGALDDAHYR